MCLGPYNICLHVYTLKIFIYLLPNLINVPVYHYTVYSVKKCAGPCDYTQKITPFIWRFDPKNYNKDVPLCFHVPKLGPKVYMQTFRQTPNHYYMHPLTVCMYALFPFFVVMSVFRTQHINKGLSGLVFQNMIFVWDQVSYLVFLLFFFI